MMNDPNLPNIAAAYAIAFVVVAAMAAGILAEHRRLKRALVRVTPRRRPGPDAR